MPEKSISLRRRQWLGRGLVAALMGSRWSWAAADGLPLAVSLPQALQQALARGEPLLVMVSLDGCAYCKAARQSYLVPMFKQGQPIVQVDMRSPMSVVDFAGSTSTHDQLTRAWKISVAPTLLFFGPKGREVADRMEGAYLPDFYGAYLDDRLSQARKLIRG